MIDDKLETNENLIRREQARFYKDLYSSKTTDPDIMNQFIEQATPQLDEHQKECCEEGIDMSDLSAALRALPNGKTPGSDGFGVDFYKFFWSSIKGLVFDSIAYSQEKGELSVEQRRSVITLIPKKDKDTRLLKNWRPISLLNTDYKILTKLLASRMQLVLPDIIHTDQVGYIKGRYIGQNIRTILDMIEYTKATQTPGMAIFLDFEKAFDSVEWTFLQKSLTTFGFGPKFVNWVKIIYSNINASIINSGFTTDYFRLERGIRQGCPLSAYLFIVAVELLAIQLRRNEHIKGINVFDRCIKLVQMADDMTVFLQDTKSLKLLLNSLHQFSRASGLKLNKLKSEAMWLGSEEESGNQPCGLKWVTEVFSLGIWFNINQEEGLNRNFADKFDKFCRALNMWKNRELSIKGKITVIKNIAMPILLYVTSNLPIPEWVVGEATRKVYQFIWNNKPDKISRETITADIENGGMKMVNFEHMFKAQKVMWVKRLISSTQATWSAFLLGYLAPFGIDIFKCSFHPEHLPCNLPLFYHQVLHAWGDCRLRTHCDDSMDAWEVRREALFFNKNILINGSYLGANLIHWYEKGIFCLHDILYENGHFYSIADLERLYDLKVDVLLYNGLKDAIPREWRRLVAGVTICRQAISSKESPFIKCKGNLKPISLVCNKDIYNLFRQIQPLVPPKCTSRWQTYFPNHNFQWTDIFKMAFVTVRCTKIQTLQYKILHRYFPCNHWLAKWNRDVQETCVRCDEVDTMEHYFYRCDQVNLFWKGFVAWWSNNMSQVLELSDTEVLFGYFHNLSQAEAVNYCILYAKSFISRMSYQSNVPYLYAYLVYLKHMLELEKFICLRNGDDESFGKYYGELYDALM